MDRLNQGKLLSPILLGGKLEYVDHISDGDVKDACTSYVKWTNGTFPHIITTIQKKRLKYLVLWVKDQVRSQEAPEFPNCTT